MGSVFSFLALPCHIVSTYDRVCSRKTLAQRLFHTREIFDGVATEYRQAKLEVIDPYLLFHGLPETTHFHQEQMCP